MYLELLGKLLFSRLSPLFFYLLLPLPLFLSSFYLYTHHKELSDLEEAFVHATLKAPAVIEKKERAMRLTRLFAGADPYFLNHSIESLSLLEKERSQIESLLKHPALSDKESLQERLSFLNKNYFSFSEESFFSSEKIKETVERQRNPVEVDEDDLMRFCSLVEHLPIESHLPLAKSPQLIFLNFQIQKVDTPFHNCHYELLTTLLKREWSDS
ncbi:MAG: hypothetical protein KGI80_00505 [Verrucomicrobiota bacterium]|nr:hypothetical protein [Verrucomicrobiota bacterium]